MLGVSRDFPKVEPTTWREQVEKDLKGVPFEKKLVFRTLDEISIQPLHTPTATRPPFVEGSLGGDPSTVGLERGWRTCQPHAHLELNAMAQAVGRDVEGGANALELRVGAEWPIRALDDLMFVLAEVDLGRIAISLDAAGDFAGAAAMLAAAWRKRGIEPSQAHALFNADPLSLLARGAPIDIGAAMSSAADLAHWTATEAPKSRAFEVSSSAYADAGASVTQALAYTMATGLEYLRLLEGSGLPPAEAAKQIVFTYDLDCTFFQAICQLRAARILWSSILEQCGVEATSSRSMCVKVRTARRVVTARDPWVNMLRATTTVFAGAIGGANIIVAEAFDDALEHSSELAQRVARNTHHILAQESHLDFVTDPAGGSWFIESLTSDLVEKAWSILRSVEGAGGMRAALESGDIQRMIEPVFQQRAQDIARRRLPITGVSEFPNVHESRPSGSSRTGAVGGGTPPSLASSSGEAATSFDARVAAFSNGARLSDFAPAKRQDGRVIEPLPVRRFADAFEDLRQASDDHLARHGSRPAAFLANLGKTAEHTPRTTFAKNFLEAGGIEPLIGDSSESVAALVETYTASRAVTARAASTPSASPLAVLCGSDLGYEAHAAAAASALKKAGARYLVLAGRPKDAAQESALREAGVDAFIHLGCDVVAALTSFHEILEINR
ncbi:MAG: methylmalonyl-CoA mutase [Deltaproteobacteria bacterium]|nr:methylmalonyl-CoA mutase [Deltaproteobacteria bacterium]